MLNDKTPFARQVLASSNPSGLQWVLEPTQPLELFQEAITDPALLFWVFATGLKTTLNPPGAAGSVPPSP